MKLAAGWMEIVLHVVVDLEGCRRRRRQLVLVVQGHASLLLKVPQRHEISLALWVQLKSAHVGELLFLLLFACLLVCPLQLSLHIEASHPERLLLLLYQLQQEHLEDGGHVAVLSHILLELHLTLLLLVLLDGL